MDGKSISAYNVLVLSYTWLGIGSEKLANVIPIMILCGFTKH